MSISWTIVEFTETNEVEAVPTPWLFNNQCYWPPLEKQKLLNEIRKCSQPNTCWPLYTVRVFKNGTFEDYLTARKKSQRAEATSDLSSTEEGRRKVKRNPIYSSSTSDEDAADQFSIISNPPQFSLATLPKADHTPSSKSNHTGNTVNSPCLKKKTDHAELIKTPTTSFASGSINESTIKIDEKNDRGNHCNCCMKHQEQLEKTLKSIAEGQNNLRAQILQFRDDIKRSNLNQEQPIQTSFFNDFHCPVASEEDIQKVNEYLEVKENFAKVVKEFSKVGGRNIYDCIRRCLSSTITNNLASKYSYHGAKQKMPFKSLKLNEAILESLLVRQDFDKKQGEEAIQKWLKRAKERKD